MFLLGLYIKNYKYGDMKVRKLEGLDFMQQI
jgi:hypothetical protein